MRLFLSAEQKGQGRFQVLLSAPYLISKWERYRGLFDDAGIELTIAKAEERLSESELLGFAGRYDGVICGDDRYSSRVLELWAPRLKVIAKWGTGLDSIDLDTAARLGVKVFNTPGAFTEAVADSVIGYVLAFARRLPEMDRAMKSGRWAKLPARALNECTLGVVGVGRIGKAVLVRARAFGMEVLGNDIVPVSSVFTESIGVNMVSLPELLAASDFVSLNCDLNHSSRHLMNRETISLMGREAVLINTARGQIVEETALIESLQLGRLGGAALDVFEEEPLPQSSPLREMKNVLLAPHNANSSSNAWERVDWNTIRNLFIGLGLMPPEPADPTMHPK